MHKQHKVRMTHEKRSAQSRTALINAAIKAIHQVGYNAASTAMIADMAGVSRGSFQHQFKTRAALMAEVVSFVFKQEMASYDSIRADGKVGHRIYEWPIVLWETLNRPTGITVLEILLASQSDEELAAEVLPMQAMVEEQAAAKTVEGFGADLATAKSVMQLMVWAVRGLSIAQRVSSSDAKPELDSAIALLSGLLRHAVPDGHLAGLKPLISCPVANRVSGTGCSEGSES